jgi:hypothetical protein
LFKSWPRNAVDEIWGKFGNPKERERLPLEAVTRGQVKMQLIESYECVP